MSIALFIRDQIEKQTKSPSTEKQISKLVFYIKEYYSAIKRNELILPTIRYADIMDPMI